MRLSFRTRSRQRRVRGCHFRFYRSFSCAAAHRLGARRLRHSFRLLIDSINDARTIPAQFLQKLDDFGDFAFA
jgi:hypothetical protein